MNKFSQSSLARLDGVHPDLVKVAHKALSISPIDFGISYGVRTLAEQERLYAQGRTQPGPKVTWTMNSLHLPQKDNFAHAIDVLAYVDGKISWDEKLYDRIAVVMKNTADMLNVKIVWGGDWKNKDRPHFELDRAFYQT